MSFLQAVLQSSVLQYALFAALGASIASGMIGSYVVVKRIVSISGSIAHSVIAGLGCALWLERSVGITWISPLYGAVIAAIFSALLIGWVHLHYREREDSVIAMIWSIGMAIGVVFVSHVPGYNVELMHYLLGNILWVTTSDLVILAVLDGVLFLVVALMYRRFLAICFDERQAQLQGLNVTSLYFLLLVLISISVVLLMYLVGIILVLSMLVLPASIAGIFTKRLSLMMVIAVVLNMLFSVGGLALSYRLNWPAGATIALFSGVIYLLSSRFRRSTRAAIP